MLNAQGTVGLDCMWSTMRIFHLNTSFQNQFLLKVIVFFINIIRAVKDVLSFHALGTQAPLGSGFGNPFATAVGSSLGSSTLGGITSGSFVLF